MTSKIYAVVHGPVGNDDGDVATHCDTEKGDLSQSRVTAMRTRELTQGNTGRNPK